MKTIKFKSNETTLPEFSKLRESHNLLEQVEAYLYVDGEVPNELKHKISSHLGLDFDD